MLTKSSKPEQPESKCKTGFDSIEKKSKKNREKKTKTLQKYDGKELDKMHIHTHTIRSISKLALLFYHSLFDAM